MLTLTLLLNGNRYFDALSTDKWEWLDIFRLFHNILWNTKSVCVCLFTYFGEIWAQLKLWT